VQGAKAVVTFGPSTVTDHGTTFAEAVVAANDGLDYMSATGKTHSAIDGPTDDSIVWWPDGVSGRALMRITSVITSGFNMTATAVVTDPAGNVVQPPAPPAPIVHDVLRFMRMCKTSDDLYDAYRNLFLAFECLLSSIRAPQQGEGESQ
jgi:hypothetical protein